jgi:hypothetical protein
MRLKREQQAMATQQGQGTIVVVNSTGNKLPTWRPGTEAEGKGFNWRTKQKMVHAWESYQLSEGLHAPKTFKSMIDPDLSPLICAECTLEEDDWEVLDDVTLLRAIEDKLRPHDAMDFTVQLKRLPFETDESKGSLTQRYRLFAEAFLAKVSEAKAAGCALQENVVKLAFGRAISGNAILQGWFEQNKWISASETHRRITNSLKMVDAYESLAGMNVRAQSAQQQQQHGGQPNPAAHQQVAQQQTQQAHQQPVQQQHYQARTNARQQNFTNQVGAVVNAALSAYQQAQLQRRPAAPMQQHTPAMGSGAGAVQQGADAGAFNAMTQTSGPLSLPPYPGLDGRGLSWHVHGPTLQCRYSPCTSMFCQACGVHGHTVEQCRKRLFKIAGINTSGYWSEQRPTSGPMLSQPGVGPFPPRPPMQFPAPAQQQSSFPTPYQMSRGGAAHHAQGQQQTQSAVPASVNNTAPRTGPHVHFATQQQPPSTDAQAPGGSLQQ